MSQRRRAAGLLAALIAGAALLAIAGRDSLGFDARATKERAAASGSAPASKRYCPRGDEMGLKTRRVVGKRTRRAKRIARRHDCTLRVVRRNGNALAVTDDFVPNRINVAVRDRRVKRVTGVH